MSVTFHCSKTTYFVWRLLLFTKRFTKISSPHFTTQTKSVQNRLLPNVCCAFKFLLGLSFRISNSGKSPAYSDSWPKIYKIWEILLYKKSFSFCMYWVEPPWRRFSKAHPAPVWMESLCNWMILFEKQIPELCWHRTCFRWNVGRCSNITTAELQGRTWVQGCISMYEELFCLDHATLVFIHPVMGCECILYPEESLNWRTVKTQPHWWVWNCISARRVRKQNCLPEISELNGFFCWPTWFVFSITEIRNFKKILQKRLEFKFPSALVRFKHGLQNWIPV